MKVIVVTFTFFLLASVLTPEYLFAAPACRSIFETLPSLPKVLRDHISDIRVLKADEYGDTLPKPEDYITPNVAQNRQSLNSIRHSLGNILNGREYADLRENRQYELVLNETIHIADKLIAAPEGLPGKDMVDLVSRFSYLVAARQAVDTMRDQSDRKANIANVSDRLSERHKRFFRSNFNLKDDLTHTNFTIPIIFVFERAITMREIMHARVSGVMLISITDKNYNTVDGLKNMDAFYLPRHDLAHYSRVFNADMEVLERSNYDIQKFRESSLTYLEELLKTVDAELLEKPSLKKSVDVLLFHAIFDSNEPVSFPRGLPQFLRVSSDNLINNILKNQYGEKTKTLLGGQSEAVRDNLDQAANWLKRYLNTHQLNAKI